MLNRTVSRVGVVIVGLSVVASLDDLVVRQFLKLAGFVPSIRCAGEAEVASQNRKVPAVCWNYATVDPDAPFSAVLLGRRRRPTLPA